MNLNVSAKNVTINANTFRVIDVELYDVSESDILNHFSAEDVVKHFGVDDILNYIDESEAIKYFGIIVRED